MAQKTLMPKKVTREELNALVDKAVDLIRTAVDYKFILVLLFMKRLNDLWKVEKCQVKKRLEKEAKLSEKEANAEAKKRFTIFLTYQSSFYGMKLRKLRLYLRSLQQQLAKLLS